MGTVLLHIDNSRENRDLGGGFLKLWSLSQFLMKMTTLRESVPGVRCLEIAVCRRVPIKIEDFQGNREPRA